MTATLPAGAQRLLPFVPTLANALIVVLIGLAGARLFWLLWPVETAQLSADLALEAPAEAAQMRVNMDRIAAAHLFGEASPEAAGTGGQEVINAPETRLNLTLTGIVSSDHDDRSRALIRDDKGEQNAYAVGDTIASGIKLHAIYSNRVILDRNGRYETLTLEREKEGAQVAQVSAGQVTGNEAGQLRNIREELLNNPSQITQYLRLQPERQGGKLVGYRIYPGQERRLFRKIGLRPGELVTAVNGIDLGDPGRNMDVLRTLTSADNLSVTLERGGEQRTMTVSFE